MGVDSGHLRGRVPGADMFFFCPDDSDFADDTFLKKLNSMRQKKINFN